MKRNLSVGVVSLLVGFGTLAFLPQVVSGETLAAIGDPYSPGFFPILIGALLMVCGGIMVTVTALGGGPEVDGEGGVESPTRLLATAGFIVAYTTMIAWIGMLAASVICVAGLAYIMGYRRHLIIAAAAATTLDGHVLAREGKARKALLVSLYSSVIGDMLATIVLIAVTAPLAAIAIKFTSPEFTILFLFALTMIAGVSGKSLTKGLIAAALGAWFGCIGLDPMSGMQRLTFGYAELTGGIALVPVLIGMFALSEILIQSEKAVVRSIAAAGVNDDSGVSRAELKGLMPTVFRSTGLGIFLGALPGLGAEIACWLSYASARRRSKNPERFGKGSLEGVAAAEAGNNATVPATLIPMLVFGIPGDTVTAVLLGAFMAQGLLAGPLLFQQHGDIIYGLFCVLLLTNVMLLVFGYWAIQYLRRRLDEYPAMMWLVTKNLFRRG